MRLDYKF